MIPFLLSLLLACGTKATETGSDAEDADPDTDTDSDADTDTDTDTDSDTDTDLSCDTMNSGTDWVWDGECPQMRTPSRTTTRCAAAPACCSTRTRSRGHVATGVHSAWSVDPCTSLGMVENRSLTLTIE